MAGRLIIQLKISFYVKLVFTSRGLILIPCDFVGDLTLIRNGDYNEAKNGMGRYILSFRTVSRFIF